MRPARIDAPQHFWTYGPEEYGWIDENMEVIQVPAPIEFYKMKESTHAV